MTDTTAHAGTDGTATSTHLVLIVDDSPDVHRLLRVRLKQENLQLQSVTDGRAAIEAANEHKPSLVLLDLDMPEMDGFEVLRHLKESPETREIPVIVLSGLQSPADKVTAFDLGAVDYVTKPFDLMELRVRLRSALRMADLIQLLAQRAHIDGLTGLYNRAAFDERWIACISENRRLGKPLSIALFDLDHFKSINDTYGHPAGDEALRVFGRLLQNECRGYDIPCRFGGEEFALIMPETTPKDAEGVCDRIRQVLERLEWPAHPERRVTVSIGVAGVDSHGELVPAAWLEQADQALYQAKTSGRNRVVVRTVPPAGAPVRKAS
ncbi:MAG: diguanylate cyclase [Phycisphaerales bacterium]